MGRRREAERGHDAVAAPPRRRRKKREHQSGRAVAEADDVCRAEPVMLRDPRLEPALQRAEVAVPAVCVDLFQVGNQGRRAWKLRHHDRDRCTSRPAHGPIRAFPSFRHVTPSVSASRRTSDAIASMAGA